MCENRASRVTRGKSRTCVRKAGENKVKSGTLDMSGDVKLFKFESSCIIQPRVHATGGTTGCWSEVLEVLKSYLGVESSSSSGKIQNKFSVDIRRFSDTKYSLYLKGNINRGVMFNRWTVT